jgi:hypothetical protein
MVNPWLCWRGVRTSAAWSRLLVHLALHHGALDFLLQLRSLAPSNVVSRRIRAHSQSKARRVSLTNSKA